ncbi:MAG: ATP-binding protein [Deinococcales bacterium]
MVEDLRTLSIAESGELNLHKSRLSVNSLLSRSAESFEQAALQAGTKLIYLPLDGDAQLEADDRQLSRVLANLIDNAIKHGTLANYEANSITLSAQVLEIEALEDSEKTSHQWLEISIRDKGQGLPEEALEQVFERFYRTDSARSRKLNHVHSGLGLSIAKAIIEAHGGDIKAENHPEGGAVFLIYLPL